MCHFRNFGKMRYFPSNRNDWLSPNIASALAPITASIIIPSQQLGKLRPVCRRWHAGTAASGRSKPTIPATRIGRCRTGEAEPVAVKIGADVTCRYDEINAATADQVVPATKERQRATPHRLVTRACGSGIDPAALSG